METLLAVYGTLRLPAVRRRLDLAGRLLPRGPCRIPGRLYDLGAYPALVLEPGGPGVAGDLLAVADPGALAILDDYEGFLPRDPASSLFVRRRVALVAPATDAEVYVYARRLEEARLVPEGDWRPR